MKTHLTWLSKLRIFIFFVAALSTIFLLTGIIGLDEGKCLAFLFTLTLSSAPYIDFDIKFLCWIHRITSILTSTTILITLILFIINSKELILSEETARSILILTLILTSLIQLVTILLDKRKK